MAQEAVCAIRAALTGNPDAQRQLESFIRDDTCAASVCVSLFDSDEIAFEDVPVKHFLASMILALGRKGSLGQPGEIWNDILRHVHVYYNHTNSNTSSSPTCSPASPSSPTSSSASSVTMLLMGALSAAAVYNGNESMNELCQQACTLSNPSIKVALLTCLVEEYNRKVELKDCSKLMENGVYFIASMRKVLKQSITPPNTNLSLSCDALYCLSQWIITFNLDFTQVNGQNDGANREDVAGISK
jgi:hypothetical protein